ncbi:MAG: hypothetical protein RIF41_07790 [Polyangiaceae bacterium]
MTDHAGSVGAPARVTLDAQLDGSDEPGWALDWLLGYVRGAEQGRPCPKAVQRAHDRLKAERAEREGLEARVAELEAFVEEAGPALDEGGFALSALLRVLESEGIEGDDPDAIQGSLMRLRQRAEQTEKLQRAVRALVDRYEAHLTKRDTVCIVNVEGAPDEWRAVLENLGGES